MNVLKTHLYTKIGLLALLLIGSLSLKAQDIHFSQFYNTPMQLNPALAGVFDGDMRFTANLRDQWSGIVPYRTAYGAFDTKFLGGKKNTSFFGGGVLFNYDHAGDSKMGTAQLGLNGSYTRQMAKSHFLSAGLQLSLNQRSFRTDQLRFDLQFNGKEYDPGLDSQEDFSDKTKFYADFGVGANWHYQPRKTRTRLDIGLALFHINQPNKSFWDETDIILPAKWSFYGLGVFQLAKKFDLVVNAMGNLQGPYTENLVTGAGRIHLDTRKTNELALQFGLGYRFNADGLGTGDAIIPAVELHRRAWIFGLSYDINVSQFDVATGGVGGPELSVIHVFRKVPEPDFCPTCPIYL